MLAECSLQEFDRLVQTARRAGVLDHAVAKEHEKQTQLAIAEYASTAGSDAIRRLCAIVPGFANVKDDLAAVPPFVTGGEALDHVVSDGHPLAIAETAVAVAWTQQNNPTWVVLWIEIWSQG